MAFANSTPRRVLRQLLSDQDTPSRAAYHEVQQAWRKQQLRRDDLRPTIVQLLSNGELDLDVNRDGCWLSLTPLGSERVSTHPSAKLRPRQRKPVWSTHFRSRRASDLTPA